MQLRRLELTDFRSWARVDVCFEPGANVLVGYNGRGKTNLVEAIGYVATLGSHRVSADLPLVRHGADAAIVRALVAAGDRELRVELEIAPGRANRAKLNGAPLRRPRDVLGALRTVLFAPEDLAIVRGDPTERRRFLDELATALAPRVAAVRADYDRVLKQRAALLKSAGAARRAGRSVELSTLDVWDAQLAEHGAELIVARLAVVERLRPHASAAVAQVAPDSAELALVYASTTDGIQPGADVAEVRAALLSALTHTRSAEIERGINLVGPHRDDLTLALGELPVRGYASHGESWTVALALRLGSFELLREHPSVSGDPVLILDDVFAELDDVRRDALALAASKAEQTIITAAVAADVPEVLDGARFTVAGGTVERG